MKTLVVSGLIILLSASNLVAANFGEVVDSIKVVESEGKPNGGDSAIGDNGKAIGPYQIHYECWRDATDFDPLIGGKYSDCNHAAYSRKILVAYLHRYARNYIRSGNWEMVARIWNGGPGGGKREQTIQYWVKVQKEINKRS